ncbi:hypothetical protein ITJ43_12150 [Microbacterium sp. VKM Ac-2870]|uniref:endonuclease domain-containing protein n=1 Tax=Microbacterium sp. VKM Ac-2870 TaxID=2783825 RepID=UPI001889C9DB|nr:endonuclease domain-containing protein [Microbacterium sp. VKM Ac-2870]MBF4562887.1 hypothetical protein [Microbacterium sp. VKM Ac-2870]
MPDASLRAQLQEPRTHRRVRDRCRYYGLTIDEFFDMWDQQGGCCALCQCTLTLRNVRIDHAHEPQRHEDRELRRANVRGLLCNGCNTALGRLERIDIDAENEWLATEIRAARDKIDQYEKAIPLFVDRVHRYLGGEPPPPDESPQPELLALARKLPWRDTRWAEDGFDIGAGVMEFVSYRAAVVTARSQTSELSCSAPDQHGSCETARRATQQ